VLIGGSFTSAAGWEWTFLARAPLALAALVAAVALIPRDLPVGARHVDPLGALVGTAAIALLVFGVVGSPDRGWWTATTVAILAGVLVAFFAVVERRSPDPLIPARSRAYGRGARREHRRVLVGASVFSMYLFISLYLQAHRTATTESRREWSAPRSSSAEHSAWRRWRPSLPTAPKPSSPEPLAVQTSRGAEGIQSAFVYGAGFALAGAVATLILLPRRSSKRSEALVELQTS
jgi:hypothetical protein